MVEEIRDLIEKINQEGIKAAEEKAQSIEAGAQQRAGSILAQAKRESEEMIAAARDRIRREEENGKKLLALAGRDLLLSLREEINAMLRRIVVLEIQQALTPGALFSILLEVVRNYSAGESGEITVLIRGDLIKALEDNFLQKLMEETKKKIILKPSEEISGGFTISFDSEKSYYDFTDKALAEYIGTSIRPKLNQILQEAVEI
jgi:vacuolar-type H+-ATPase subunit E/Vma4